MKCYAIIGELLARGQYLPAWLADLMEALAR